MHVWLMIATTLTLAAPIWLGPAAPYLLLVLGSSSDHRCACGMKKGKCGCLECAAEEQEHAAKTRSAVPVLKSSCAGDEIGVAASLPAVVLASFVRLPAPSSSRTPIVVEGVRDPSRTRAPPLPPPPRSSTLRA